MKKYKTIILKVSLFVISVFVFSCSSNQVLRDCDCDEYMVTDTVKITIVDTTETVKLEKETKYFVQIGCFANRLYAERFAENAKINLSSAIMVILSKDNLYRIFAGEYKEIENARVQLNYVKIKGYSDAFIRDEYGPVEK
jgi:hypothetical protein